MIDVRRCLVTELFEDPRCPDLIRGYAEECMTPGAEPQRALYEAMEAGGALVCFGAYDGRDLVGFVSVLSNVMPHDGQRLATTESLFVAPAHRAGGTFSLLISAALGHAVERKCSSFMSLARTESTLARVLTYRAGWKPTHIGFTRRLL